MIESDPQQELAFIKKIMVDSRKITFNYGKYFIIPSALITLAIFADFAVYKMQMTRFTPWIWASAIIGSWIFSYLTRKHDRPRVRVTTVAGKLISTTWVGCSIAMALLISAGNINGALKAWSVQPIIALFIGVGFFITGAILNYSLLRLLALGWWCGAIVMFILPSEYTPLIIGSMMIVFYLLPGIILYYHWKKKLGGES